MTAELDRKTLVVHLLMEYRRKILVGLNYKSVGWSIYFHFFVM